MALGEFVEDRVQDHKHRTLLYNIYFQAGGVTATPVTETGGSGIGTVGDIVVGRYGNTTEVKAVGVNYIIKAKQVSVPFDVAEYIRNQNVLSAWESITLPKQAASAITMRYDGILNTTFIVNAGGSSCNFFVNINGIVFWGGGSADTGDTVTVPFKKGDKVYHYSYSGQAICRSYVAYYKLRDYTGR